VKPYYTPVDRFVRKSCGADFKVQGNFKLDDVVGPGICTKQGFEGQPGQETTQYQVDAVRKIGCSSLLLDDTFHPGGGTNGTVLDLALQSDGKVFIGGQFTKVNYSARNRVARLNEDGSLDTTFDPGNGANCTVSALAVQIDGKVVIGGCFTSVGGESRRRVARLQTDGLVDIDFDTSSGANDSVSDLAVQLDGKVIIVGEFTEVDGEPCNRIARLKGDA